MDKNVVLISPDFFNLSTLVHDEIEKCGYKCKWFDDRPSKKTIDKMLIRLSPSFLKKKINKYFDNIVDYCKENKPSKIIVIIGQSFGIEHYQRIRDILPETELVFYNWDSMANFPLLMDNLTFFDRVYSFDSSDCEKYNIPFLPLFYSYNESSIVPDLDYSLITTVKKGKYADLHNIVSQLNQVYENRFLHLYLQSKSMFTFYKLKEKSFKKAKKNEFVYHRLPANEVENVFNRSKIIVDIVMAKQSGLTIRTIDALHLKKKLITNNESIKQYPFYHEDNILVCKHGDKIDFKSNFFTKPFNEKYLVGETYCLNHFIKVLLGEVK